MAPGPCDGTSVTDLLESISALPQWQIALTATWLLLQGCIAPSVPEDILILTLGMLVGQGRIEPAAALVAVLAGLLPANAVAVLIGSVARTRLGRAGWFGKALGSPRVERASALLRRHGPLVVLLTRFTPFVRGPVYLSIGLSGLGVPRFALLDALAASVQVPVLLWIGSRLGSGVSPQQAWARVGWTAAALIAAAVAVAVSRRAWASCGGRREQGPPPPGRAGRGRFGQHEFRGSWEAPPP